MGKGIAILPAEGARVDVLQFLRRVVCALILALSLGCSNAFAQNAFDKTKIALVIGNGRYDHVESLANPTNDSDAMREKLAGLGFEVYGGDNLSRAEFEAKLAEFKLAAENAATVVIYYSGHGFQLNGRNYLVPRDAALKSVDAIERETIRLDRMISDLQASDRQMLVFLDACRNNPLPPAQRQNNGLAQIETGSNDVYVAFATQPGNISYDGRATLSPFTRAITDEIDKPGQNISDMMIKVRNEVQKQTLYQQTPWEQSSLTRQFYFSGVHSARPNTTVSALEVGPSVTTDILGLPRSSGVAPGAEASLAPQQPGTLYVPNGLGDGHSNVIILPEAPIELFGNEELVLGVQTELQRVGCYVGEIDGVWSKASGEALSKYYTVKKMQDLKAAPTEFDLDSLKRSIAPVCKQPKPKPAYVAPSRPRRQDAVSRPSGGASRGGNRRQVSTPARGNNRPAARAPSGPSRPAAPPKKQIENTNVLGAFR